MPFPILLVFKFSESGRLQSATWCKPVHVLYVHQMQCLSGVMYAEALRNSCIGVVCPEALRNRVCTAALGYGSVYLAGLECGTPPSPTPHNVYQFIQSPL
jgi:hypothetical protein